MVLAWKEQLIQSYAPASVNSMLAAVNSFLDWCGLPQYKVKPLKIQRNLFAKPEQELTRAEYNRLVEAAERDVAALQTGRATVDCKGKTRIVFLPKDLCRALRHYCREQSITSGVIFRTHSGKPIDRSNIWRMMKSLCKSAHVEQGKVFPHNLRHLFAKTYYSLEKDLSRLADLLGHSNVNTTKIYTMESGTKHAKQLDRMGLILART